MYARLPISRDERDREGFTKMLHGCLSQKVVAFLLNRIQVQCRSKIQDYTKRKSKAYDNSITHNSGIITFAIVLEFIKVVHKKLLF